jgi:hypothetical protein
MALGLAVKVEGVNPNLDDQVYYGVTGITFSSDESTITITGSPLYANQQSAGNTATINMETTLMLSIFHRPTQFVGISVDSQSE